MILTIYTLSVLLAGVVVGLGVAAMLGMAAARRRAEQHADTPARLTALPAPPRAP